MIGQPAPCDGMSAVYSSTGSFSPRRASSSRRILALVAGEEQTLQSVLAIACLDNRTTASPKLIYTGQRIKLYETQIVAGGGSGQ